MAEASVVSTDDKAAEQDEKFLETVRKNYAKCIEAERENRTRAKEALAFRNLEQWDTKIKTDRDRDGRPCVVVDKLNQHVQQVVNDERQNRPQIKVRPVDDKGDPEVAKIYDGIIRHIQDASHADVAYDTGFEQAVDGGFGYWRVLTEYCDPLSMEQDLRIKRLRNRFAVYLDPERQEPDGSDAKYGFILYKLSKEKYKDEHGKVAEESIADFGHAGKEFADWYGDDWVLLAEYYWIEKKKLTIVMQVDGKVVPKDEWEKMAEPRPQLHPGVERKTEIPRVRWRLCSGNKILSTTEWPGYCIPIVEVVGSELDIEGKVYRSGMIRPAMDSQRLDNYATSAFIENVALAPTSSYVAEESQIAQYADEWRDSSKKRIGVLRYKAREVAGSLIPPPRREAPPGIPAGWQAVLMHAEHNIQASMGRYDASLGEESNEKSGRAIIARQRKGDIGSFHYSDNLTRSLRHTGQILVEVLPKFYDTKRVARILGEDGTPDSVTVDPGLVDEQGQPAAYKEVKDEAGKVIEKIYNLGVGKYDVTVVAGPSYATRRMEAAEAMLEISRGDPEFLAKFGDIIFQSQDWPGAEKIAERFKKMLPAELATDEEGNDHPAVAALKAQLEQAVNMIKELQGGMEAQKLEIEGYNAETKRLTAESGTAVDMAKIKEIVFNAVKEYVDRSPAEDSALLAPQSAAPIQQQ